MFLRRAFPPVHFNLLETTLSAEPTLSPEGEFSSEPKTEDDSYATLEEGELPLADDQLTKTSHSEQDVPRIPLLGFQPHDPLGCSASVESPLTYDSNDIPNPLNSVSTEDKSLEGEQATTMTINPPEDTQIDDEPRVKVRTRRRTSSFPSFLQKLAESSKQTVSSSDTSISSNPSPSTPLHTSPTRMEEDDDVGNWQRSRRSRGGNPFPTLRPIVEYDRMESDAVPSSSKSSSGPSFNLVSTSAFAKKMEEAGRLRRLQSQSLAGTPPVTSTTPPPPPPLKLPNDQLDEVQDLGLEPTLSVTSTPPPPPPPKFINGHSDVNKAPSISETKPEKPEDDTTLAHHLSDVLELIQKSELEKLQKAKDEEIDELHDALQRALTELEEAREQNALLLSRSNEEKRRLTQQYNTSLYDAAILRNEKQTMEIKVSSLQSQLNKSEAELKALKKDQKGWQGQLNAMRERVDLADKRIRYMDGLTRLKLEARMEGALGPTRRSQKAVNTNPSAEVVNAVVGLNEEITQAASLLVDNLERAKTPVPPTAMSRAKTMFGKKMIGLLQAQAANPSSGFQILLTQAALEAFMVRWSMNIIEAWYPVRQTFADLLIDLGSQVSSSKTPVECGKVKIVDTTPSATVQFPEWVKDILKDLALVLTLSGLRMKPGRAGIFTSKFLVVVKMAYNVRTALAESDICGGIEACDVAGDMPFHAKTMDEAYVSNRLKSSSTSNMEAEYIASTSAIGLRRLTTDSQNKTVTTMVLKPKVVLVRVLEESP